MNLVKLINKLDAHHRLYFSVSVAIAVFLIFLNRFSVSQQFIVTWVAYSLTYLILAWISILFSHPKEIQKTASTQDASRTLIFIFVVTASFISLFVVVFLLRFTKSFSQQELLIYGILTTLSVISAWWTVHTVFAFRYAHLFYSLSGSGVHKDEFIGGLEFPKEPEPDYLDFVYFSFIIGMTFQVSDVEISSRRIRRIVWIHSLISFVFNTVIVALSINIISSLIQK